MRTESEARKCWCPYARNVQIGGASDAYTFSQPFNRLSSDNGKSCDGFNDNPEAARCIASECMAWRWSIGDGGLDHLEIGSGVSLALSTAGIRSARQLQAMTDAEIMEIPRIGMSAKMEIRRALRTFFQRAGARLNSVGYCGLAGRP